LKCEIYGLIRLQGKHNSICFRHKRARS